jgi:hypothetical protein
VFLQREPVPPGNRRSIRVRILPGPAPIGNRAGPARLVSIGIALGHGGGGPGSGFGSAVSAMAVQAAGTSAVRTRVPTRPGPIGNRLGQVSAAAVQATGIVGGAHRRYPRPHPGWPGAEREPALPRRRDVTTPPAPRAEAGPAAHAGIWCRWPHQRQPQQLNLAASLKHRRIATHHAWSLPLKKKSEKEGINQRARS